MSMHGMFFLKDGNFKGIHEYIEEFMDTVRLQLEISTNAQSLHNSLNRNINSHSRNDREIGDKKFNGNKPLQYNNSSDKNAYQKPPFNKNFSNTKSGNNLVNNIDEEGPIGSSSDEEEEFAPKNDFENLHRIQNKSNGSNDSSEEYDDNCHSDDDLLAEIIKNTHQHVLKPTTSIRMGNPDKIVDLKKNSDEACIRYTIHGKCAAGVSCKYSHKEKDCQALWEQLRNNLDKSSLSASPPSS
jgi:hypothetical protein